MVRIHLPVQGSVPGSRRTPGEGNGSPLQCFFLENPMDRRCLLGYSPWGHKESDTTEGLDSNNDIFHKMLLKLRDVKVGTAAWGSLLGMEGRIRPLRSLSVLRFQSLSSSGFPMFGDIACDVYRRELWAGMTAGVQCCDGCPTSSLPPCSSPSA